jgi:hypothetical protein
MFPLNTVKENQIYFVLSHTFEPFFFFLPPLFVTLRLLSSQVFLRFEVLVSTSFF